MAKVVLILYNVEDKISDVVQNSSIGMIFHKIKLSLHEDNEFTLDKKSLKANQRRL